jgi:hypothetical protein
LSRAADATAGHLWFRAAPVLADTANLRSLFRELYAEPALPPPVSRGAEPRPVAPPEVRVEGETLTVSADIPVRAYVLYRSTSEGWQADRLLPPGIASVTPGSGTWAVSAVDRHGTESQAVSATL